MGSYREMIESLKEKWIGKKVEYEGSVYTVVDVDYNAMIIIDKPAKFTRTTAVDDAINPTKVKLI